MALVEKIERPAYRVLDPSGFFGDNDTLYAEGEEIYYDGEPALEMEPLNEAAKDKYLALLERLDSEGRKVAEKLGRPYVGMPRSLEGALQIATAVQRQDMSLMGNHEKETTTSTVKRDEINNFGVSKRGRGRPKKESISSVA